MPPINIIERLKKATGPDRLLDRDIAVIVGYRRRVGPNGNAEWYKDGVDEIGIPFYTKSLDAAYSFASTMAPDRPCACIWRPLSGEAHMDGFGKVRAANAAIAICIATLQTMTTSYESD